MNRKMRIALQLNKKMRSTAAFTLAETLVAILILLMVSTVLAAGIPAAKRAYEGVETASNAELLLSTTISTLRNELGMAEEVEVSGNVITYYNPSTGSKSKIYKDDDGVIWYSRYASTDMSKADGAPVRLINNSLSTKVGLEVTYGTAALSGDCIVFTDLQVKDGSTVMTSRPSVSIRMVSYR